jgi:hypothetical protein
VVSAAVAAGGTGGANGVATVTGTTGTGSKFQAIVTISGGAITGVNAIMFGGLYTANPANLTAEPVTGAGLTGATLSINMGVGDVSLTSGGVFSANPAGGFMTQASTSGSGTGASFQSVLFGPATLSLVQAGSYSTLPTNPVSQASTTGGGSGATFTLSSGSGASFANGAWVFISSVNGMTELNGNTYVIGGVAGNQFSLFDVYGNPVDATAFSPYVSGGAASEIFTLTTPWAEADLPYLKFTQSADVMSICCVNQQTLAEYPPYDLSRISDTNWTLAQVAPAASIAAPPSASGFASSSGSVFYQYEITAIAPDGTESVAATIAEIYNAVDIAATAGTITISWAPVAGANGYNVYKATPGYTVAPPAGSLFGFAGQAFGTQFIDSNIIADFTQVPPTHENPFAPGQVLAATPTNGGGGYSNISYTVHSATGTNVALEPVLQNGSLVAIIVIDPGQDYKPGDTITFTGDGSGAAASLTIGPESGTYPSTVAYFQQRRAYASSLNNPDTYWMSQPGSFTNFDSRIPTIASDAITGSPWSVQVDGIQWMINMPGGLVVLTGVDAWQLTGQGGSSLNPQPISPSTQQAQPQAFNGASATVPPIKIDFDIIYLQSKGTKYRDLSYQIFTNIYTGTDITVNSSHLFENFTIKEHAWCLEPAYVLWAVRNDGVLLSLTFVKPEQVQGWARHDTNGLFQSVCSVSEPPVDALYAAVERQIGANTAYTIERMDNRQWQTAEGCWCVDCGLELTQPTPNATLLASSATGAGTISGFTNLVGGKNYSAATMASVVDDEGQGPGTGCTIALTIVAGVIIGLTISTPGQNYIYPKLIIYDPAGSQGGSGASADLTLDNSATFKTSAAAFTAESVGSVIRSGGGRAVVTQFVSSTQVIADITNPITAINPISGQPTIQASGNWTLTAPVTQVSGLDHLVGATVTGLADGNVIPPTVVAADGSVTLATPASAVVIGLGFTAQCQGVYLDAGQPTIQGQRKKIDAATARVTGSRGLQMGSNQPDGSTLSPPQLAPTWNDMDPVPDTSPYDAKVARKPFNSPFQPLYTGDRRIVVKGGYNKPGQVAMQQVNPLPMEILAYIPEVMTGDTSQTQQPKAPQQSRGAQARQMERT